MIPQSMYMIPESMNMIPESRMKIRSLAILAVLLASGTGLYAQDLEDVLAEHYRAAEQEKMTRMETMIIRGKSIFTSINLESPFTLYRARPDRIRVESNYQGSGVIQTYDGKKGWIYAPAMGIPEPREVTGEELEALLNQAEFEDPLWKYKEKGHALELVGNQARDADYQLKLTPERGNAIHFFLDRKTYLINSYVSRQIMGGTENEIEVIMDEYRNVKGIPVAHRTETRMNGQVVTTVRLEDVDFNKKLDPSLFEKPAAAGE